MTTRTRRLAFAGGAVFVVALLIWALIPNMGPPMDGPSSISPVGESVGHPAPISPGSPASPALRPGRAVSSEADARRTYALGLHDLSGLSPDVQEGQRLELWVTWEPPITKKAQVQLLLDDVSLVRLVPPVTPEGPTSVLLSLPAQDIPELLYGDRYGQLSAVAPQ
ncbi:MAG: hypothetical protein ACRDLB_12050 [Actinomycetota bacterium]